MSQRYGLRAFPGTLARRHEAVRSFRARLLEAGSRSLESRRRRVAGCSDRLRALSPLHVLERGFCIARRADGSLVRASDALAIGELLALQFHRGGADARVETLRRAHDADAEPDAS